MITAGLLLGHHSESTLTHAIKVSPALFVSRACHPFPRILSTTGREMLTVLTDPFSLNNPNPNIGTQEEEYSSQWDCDAYGDIHDSLPRRWLIKVGRGAWRGWHRGRGGGVAHYRRHCFSHGSAQDTQSFVRNVGEEGNGRRCEEQKITCSSNLGASMFHNVAKAWCRHYAPLDVHSSPDGQQSCLTTSM